MTNLFDFSRPHRIDIKRDFQGVSAEVRDIPGLYIYVDDPRDFQHKLHYGIKELFRFRSVIDENQEIDVHLENEIGEPIEPASINSESKTYFRILKVR